MHLGRSLFSHQWRHPCCRGLLRLAPIFVRSGKLQVSFFFYGAPHNSICTNSCLRPHWRNGSLAISGSTARDGCWTGSKRTVRDVARPTESVFLGDTHHLTTASGKDLTRFFSRRLPLLTRQNYIKKHQRLIPLAAGGALQRRAGVLGVGENDLECPSWFPLGQPARPGPPLPQERKKTSTSWTWLHTLPSKGSHAQLRRDTRAPPLVVTCFLRWVAGSGACNKPPIDVPLSICAEMLCALHDDGGPRPGIIIPAENPLRVH